MPKGVADAFMREYFGFTDAIRKSGHYLGGEALQPVSTATTVRVRNGRISTTDGPFAETKEQLGGFYLIEARDLNDAIQVAAADSVGADGQRRGPPDHGVRPSVAETHEPGRGSGAGDGGGGLPVGLAPGARHPHPPARRLRSAPKRRCTRPSRPRCERWPQRRRSGQPAGVAGFRRTVQGDRRHAAAGPLRRLAGRAGRAARPGSRTRRPRGRRRDGRGRPAAADLHLLPSGAAAGRAGRADAARGLRPHHRGDRPRVPDARARRWRSGSCAPRRRSATRAFPIRCRRAPSCPDRLDAVLHVVYLVFNEGYSASSGASLTRHDLSAEAIRLGRLLVELLPEPEAIGLLGADAAARIAARRAHLADGRAGAAGRPGPVAAGTARRSRRAPRWSSARCASRRFGPYTLQAAIAAVHAEAPTGRGDRLGADRRALRRAAARRSVAGGRAEPRRRRGDARRPGGGAGADRRDPGARRARRLSPGALGARRSLPPAGTDRRGARVLPSGRWR